MGKASAMTLAPQPWTPPITEHTDRATIVARLVRLNGEAMALSRRGQVGTRCAEYEVRHATLSLLLYQWQQSEP